MTQHSARVTIVTRTRDRATLLARALDDILAQTMRDWELVIVNDGGDIAPIDTLLSERDAHFAGRVRVIHRDEAHGMEAASNLAVAESTAALLAIHDDDDTWAPDFLEISASHLDAHPEAAAVVLPTEIVFEALDGDRLVETGREPFGVPHNAVTVFDLLLMNRMVPISMLLRRDAFDRLGGFDESLPVTGDWEFNLRLATHERIDYLPGEPRAFWHQRPSVQGNDANTVSNQHEHWRVERLVRDRAIRAHLARTGGGDLLYLSRYIDEALRGAEDRIVARVAAEMHALAAAEAAARESAPASRPWGARVRGAISRVRPRR